MDNFVTVSPQLQVKLSLNAELALFLLNPATPPPVQKSLFSKISQWILIKYAYGSNLNSLVNGRRPQLCWKWKTTYIFFLNGRQSLTSNWSWPHFFLNGRQPQLFWKWKTTSIFLKMEDNLIFLKMENYLNSFENWSWPHFFCKWKTTSFFWKRRRPKFFAKWNKKKRHTFFCPMKYKLVTIGKLEDDLNFLDKWKTT